MNAVKDTQREYWKIMVLSEVSKQAWEGALCPEHHFDTNGLLIERAGILATLVRYPNVLQRRIR